MGWLWQMQLTKHNAKQQNRINKRIKKKKRDSKRFKASAVESVPRTVNYDQFYVFPTLFCKGEGRVGIGIDNKLRSGIIKHESWQES